MDSVYITIGLVIIVTLTIFPIVETVRYWDRYNWVERLLWSINIIFATLLLIGISAG